MVYANIAKYILSIFVAYRVLLGLRMAIFGIHPPRTLTNMSPTINSASAVLLPSTSNKAIDSITKTRTIVTPIIAFGIFSPRHHARRGTSGVPIFADDSIPVANDIDILYYLYYLFSMSILVWVSSSRSAHHNRP